MYKINGLVTSFKNQDEEIKYWKNHALTLESKYNDLLLVYASKIGIKKNWMPISKRKIEFNWFENDNEVREPLLKKPKLIQIKDPADFSAKIQDNILKYLTTKDLLKMTEVSKKWKLMAEKKLPPLKLNVNLINNHHEEITLSSSRLYTEIMAKYDNYSKGNTFDIINQISNSLEKISIGTVAPKYLKLRPAIFPKIQIMKFFCSIPDDICDWLEKSCFENLQVLHIQRKGHNRLLIEFLYALTNLKELRVVGNNEFFYCWEELCENTMSIPQFSLEKLHLSMLENANAIPQDFLLSQNTSLRSLTIEELLDADVVLLILYEFPMARELTLSFNENISTHDISMITNGSNQRNTYVKKLTLQEVDFLPDEFIITLILVFPNLVELNLDFSTLTFNIMEIVAYNLLKLDKIYCEKFDDLARERYNFLKMTGNEDVNKNIKIITTKYVSNFFFPKAPVFLTSNSYPSTSQQFGNFL